MYYAYVVKSESNDFYYKGHCKNLATRVKQHNAGATKSLKPYLPVHLVYYEIFETRAAAIERERYFKTAAGRKYFINKLKLSEVLYPGSLPE